MLISAEVIRGKDSVFSALAFNDVAVNRGNGRGMIEFEVHIDGGYVYSLRSDGLIVATPTGSTAYSLSSGGPIIAPNVHSFVITPISAHTLNSRPLVVSADSRITIKFSSYNDSIMLITDGQLHEILSSDDNILASTPRS